MMIAVSILLTAITVQAAGMIPQGLWEVEQVTVEKATDSSLKINIYNTAGEMQSYLPCPQEWEIGDAQTIKLRYADGWEETAKYTLEGNQLKIHAAAAMQSYQYSIEGETITLSCTYNYLNNLPTGQTERIEEKWIMILKK